MTSIEAAAVSGDRRPRLFTSVDIQMVALMRCLLAVVALVAISVDGYRNPLHSVLLVSVVGYGIYSVAICIGNFRGLLTLSRVQPWIDVSFYAYLIALTHGGDSIFFLFFFFAIVAAAFSKGFQEGLSITLFAALAVVVISLAGYAAGRPLDLTQLATRSISLFILGYMIAYWCGNEFGLRKRLSLLRELAISSTPHNTLESVISGQLTRLCDFFRAEVAVIALPGSDGQSTRMYRVEGTRGATTMAMSQTGEALALPLLSPLPLLLSYDANRVWHRVRTSNDRGVLRLAEIERLESQCAELANLLEAQAFLCVDYRPNPAIVGRLYLMSSKRSFADGELEFLAHVSTQMAATANDIMLTEELANRAAHHERSRISRDIHDTTIQSYIGLKLGLEALYRDIAKNDAAAVRIKELLDMATLTVDDLRGYVNRLRERGDQGDAQLLARIDEQRRRYETFHDIQIEVRADKSLVATGNAGVEAYQIVSEALSNIVRHTSSKRAFVDLRCEGESLAIRVGNERGPNCSTAPFIPRSITERAMSLGGQVQVKLNDEGQDVVKVTIPLKLKVKATTARRTALAS